MRFQVERVRDTRRLREVWSFELLFAERASPALVLDGYVEEDRPSLRHGWSIVIREGRERRYERLRVGQPFYQRGAARPLGHEDVYVPQDVERDARAVLAGAVRVARWIDLPEAR